MIEIEVKKQAADIRADYKLKYIEFYKKFCITCRGTMLQHERQCAELKGCSKTSCEKMERWIHSRQKKAKEYAVQKMMEEFKEKVKQ